MLSIYELGALNRLTGERVVSAAREEVRNGTRYVNNLKFDFHCFEYWSVIRGVCVVLMNGMVDGSKVGRRQLGRYFIYLERRLLRVILPTHLLIFALP